MPRRCAETLPLFEEKTSLCSVFSFVVVEGWRGRFGGRAWGERYLSGFIGVKCFVRRNISVDPSRLTLRINCIVICGCVRRLPTFNGAQIHWERSDWRQLEEEITKARASCETIASIYRSQFAFLYDRIRALESGETDTILWKLTAEKLVFDIAKSSARLDNAAKDPSTHYNSPVYRTHPYGYNFFVQFYPYGLDAAAGNHASIMFALFPGDYDGLLKWPFSKTIHLSVRDQLDPQNTWTISFAPSDRLSFRRPTREPLPTLMNFNFFPHSKMFSKTENFLSDNTL